MYLVLDDYKNGFTIHKLDVDNDDLDVGCGSAENPGCIPEPPLVCIGPPAIEERPQFAALGSHIIDVCPSEDGLPLIEDGGCGATVVFDTKTVKFCLSKILPSELLFVYEAAMAVIVV